MKGKNPVSLFPYTIAQDLWLHYHLQSLLSFPFSLSQLQFFSLSKANSKLCNVRMTLLGTSSPHCSLSYPTVYSALHLWSVQLSTLSSPFGVVSISGGGHNSVRFIRTQELEALKKSTASLRNRFFSLLTLQKS